MVGETIGLEQAAERDSESSRKRIRSSIEFPYSDQDDAIRVVRAIHDNAGMSCTTDQLAAYLKQPPTSGTFRVRLSAARIFSFVETERGGKVSLTSLGQRVADPDQEREARAESFLNVRLYRAIFEKFKGYTLPPSKALEREMVSFGVSPKQAERARQAFLRSAELAGYFQHGSDRLVAPAFKNMPSTKPLDTETNERPERVKTNYTGGGDNGGRGGDLHPFIQGLLEKLPVPDSDWDIDECIKWLQTAAHIFSLMYKMEGSISVAKGEKASHEPRRERE